LVLKVAAAYLLKKHQEMAAMKIITGRRDDKVVPTDFFGQADARHISAVLFSNAGTMAKFEESATQKERIVLSG
jgi:hypothetical protein